MSALMAVDNTKNQEQITRQNKIKSRRVKTLFKKAKELQDATGCQVFLYVKDQYNHVKFGGSSNLRKKFKEGQLSLEAAKKQEVHFNVIHPRPTGVRHLKSMWPGTVQNADEASFSTSDDNEAFVEEGSSIDGESVEELTTEEEDTDEENEDAIKDSKHEERNVEDEESGMGEEKNKDQEEERIGDDSLEGLEEETEANMGETDEDNEPLSILKKVMDGEVEEEENSQDDTVYTVSQVRKKREREGKVEYLVKWKGWAEKYNSWEPEDHILDKQLIEDFNARTKKRKTQN